MPHRTFNECWYRTTIAQVVNQLHVHATQRTNSTHCAARCSARAPGNPGQCATAAWHAGERAAPTPATAGGCVRADGWSAELWWHVATNKQLVGATCSRVCCALGASPRPLSQPPNTAMTTECKVIRQHGLRDISELSSKPPSMNE
jgi:hypothetical protein